MSGGFHPGCPNRIDTARQAGEAPQTMEQRADAMFGPTLSSTRTLVNRFSQGYDRYMQACEGKTTQGNWLMILGDWRSPTGFSSFTAQTETSNATTPECRMLAVDVLTDAKAISVNLNAVADRSHTAGIWPGVMRDLYAKYSLEEVVSAVVRYCPANPDSIGAAIREGPVATPYEQDLRSGRLAG